MKSEDIKTFISSEYIFKQYAAIQPITFINLDEMLLRLKPIEDIKKLGRASRFLRALMGLKADLKSLSR